MVDYANLVVFSLVALIMKFSCWIVVENKPLVAEDSLRDFKGFFCSLDMLLASVKFGETFGGLFVVENFTFFWGKLFLRFQEAALAFLVFFDKLGHFNHFPLDLE